MSEPTLQVTQDFTKDFNEVVSRFKRDAVLVGIPAQDNSRKEEEGDIGNAAILAINHFGSEKAGIPPRPVLFIGLKNAQEQVAEILKTAAREALSKGAAALTLHYNRAGSVAASACKKVINDQDRLSPPSEATLKARQYLTQAGFKGTKSLLVTGQLRNAITYVVKSPWGN